MHLHLTGASSAPSYRIIELIPFKFRVEVSTISHTDQTILRIVYR